MFTIVTFTALFVNPYRKRNGCHQGKGQNHADRAARFREFLTWAKQHGIFQTEFADRLGKQAKRFGAETLVAQEVQSITTQNGYKMVTTSLGDEYCARAIILCAGSTYRRIGVSGEEAFIGSGVHFCATCDRPLYQDQGIRGVG